MEIDDLSLLQERLQMLEKLVYGSDFRNENNGTVSFLWLFSSLVIYSVLAAIVANNKRASLNNNNK